MTLKPRDEALDIAATIVANAIKAGADQADALFVQSEAEAASVRDGKLEDIEGSESQDLGLRVFVGRSQAMVSTTDFRPTALAEAVERAVAMARIAPEDPYAGLADTELLVRQARDLDLVDTAHLDSQTLVDRAMAAEAAGLAVDGVRRSSGAGADQSRSSVALATSGGFEGAYDGTSYGVGLSLIAGDDNNMQQDYAAYNTRHLSDLRAPEEIGREAGEKAARRVNPIRLETGPRTVVFDPRVSGSFATSVTGAISGSAITRGSSFLLDKLDEQIANSAITIMDDPHRLRGLRSKPFDGEGTENRPMRLVENGVLKHYLLDHATALQLGRRPNGRAARGTGAPPSPAPTNLYIEAGALSPTDLISDIKDGFYVTEFLGQGPSLVTGDYSRGAAGFHIVNGELAEPVSEVTIAGNLKEMLMAATPASDLEFVRGVNAPTIRVDRMTVAGI